MTAENESWGSARWVALRDKSPPTGPVLATDGRFVEQMNWFAGFEDRSGDTPSFVPTHWMPMPSPPPARVRP